jgi:hypothetical protein
LASLRCTEIAKKTKVLVLTIFPSSATRVAKWTRHLDWSLNLCCLLQPIQSYHAQCILWEQFINKLFNNCFHPSDKPSQQPRQQQQQPCSSEEFVQSSSKGNKKKMELPPPLQLYRGINLLANERRRQMHAPSRSPPRRHVGT